MLHELGRAARSWMRTPRLTLAIIACTAVSIGGASTVLTFVYSLLWRPLPFPEASRLVLFQPRNQDRSLGARPYLSYPDFADLRSAATSFERLEAATVSRLVVITGNGAERLRGEAVTPGYFDILGLKPQRGRTFTADEYAGRGERALIISSRLWRTQFGARAELIGQPVQTRVGPAIVVGVLPEGYLGVAEIDGTDYWLAERQTNHPPILTERADPTTMVFGRLKPGVTAKQAEGEVASLLAAIAKNHPPANRELAGSLIPLGEKWRADLRPGLITMLVASLFLLTIGCGNVAILLLARLVTRERDLAVRLAVGATRRDLVKLMGAEGSLLALAGGLSGVALSAWLGEIFRAVGGVALPLHLPVAFGAGPLLLCLVVVLLTGLAFSLLPAAVATRVDSPTALRSGGRSVVSGALQGRGGQMLVVGQTALAFALLAGAALFIRSYERLRFLDVGYRTENLLRYQVSLQREAYPTPDSIDAFYRQLTLDLRAIPGVRHTGYLGPTLPPWDANQIDIRLKGQDFPTKDGALTINQHVATNDVFSILGVPLKEGRLFGPEDRRGGPAVGVVSETLARTIAPHGSAVGRVLLFEGFEVNVVGVVKDARWNGQRDRRPSGRNLFLSLDQFPQLSVGVLFDPTIEARSLIDPVRKVVLNRDPLAALHWIDTLDEALDYQTMSERFWTFLAASYAATAFLLSIFGLYGILTHGVVSRTREIGVRLALGATSGDVARFVAGQGFRLVATGLLAGLPLVLAMGRLIASRLYETSAADPVSLTAVLLLLAVAGAVIAWLPARRAAAISPLTALRTE